MRTFIIICLSCCLMFPAGQVSGQDLVGRPAVTVFRNATSDTILIRGTHYNWLPYAEHNFYLRIPPGRADSLILLFNFPDLLAINQTFYVLNAPGKRVVCTVVDLKRKAVRATFIGDLQLENNYYLQYSNFLGNQDQESRGFYDAGNKLTDFNRFPAIADSISKVRLDFLAAHQNTLPGWFKSYERDRLVHNGIMRKYNVLLSKIFYGGKAVPVDTAYYDFERSVRLADTVPISASYLWAVDDYIYHRSGRVLSRAWQLIDTLMPRGPLSDAIKMRRLGMLYSNNRASYQALLKMMTFSSPAIKVLVDSLIQTRLGLPKAGQKAPALVLKDLEGKTVRLSDFSGRPIIINFWAEWCGPCKAEFPAENQLYQKYKGQGLAVLNVCIETKEANWRLISQASGLKMVNLYAGPEVYPAIKTAYHVGALPRSIAVGRNQKVVAAYYPRASSLKDQDIQLLMNGR